MRTLNTTSTDLRIKINRSIYQLIEAHLVTESQILDYRPFPAYSCIGFSTLIINTRGNTPEQDSEIWEAIINNLGISGLDTTFYNDWDIFIDNDGTGSETIRLTRAINHISLIYNWC